MYIYGLRFIKSLRLSTFSICMAWFLYIFIVIFWTIRARFHCLIFTIILDQRLSPDRFNDWPSKNFIIFKFVAKRSARAVSQGKIEKYNGTEAFKPKWMHFPPIGLNGKAWDFLSFIAFPLRGEMGWIDWYRREKY